jgi:hypothetical protein
MKQSSACSRRRAGFEALIVEKQIPPLRFPPQPAKTAQFGDPRLAPVGMTRNGGGPRSR